MIRLMNQNNLKLKPNIFRGLSSDKKPTKGVRNGDQFFEMDTGFLYMYEQADGVWLPTDFSNPSGVSELFKQIYVDTDPTTVRYRSGETLDLTGAVIKLDKMDGSTYTVTSDCTFSPANGDALTMEDKYVNVEYVADNGQKLHAYIPLNVYELKSIVVTKLPDIVSYDQFDSFITDGMTVLAVYTDETSNDVTSGVTTSPADEAELDSFGKQTVSVSFTDGGITATTGFPITVAVGKAVVGNALVGYNYVGVDIS